MAKNSAMLENNTSETDVALKAISGTDGRDWISPGGAMLRAPWGKKSLKHSAILSLSGNLTYIYIGLKHDLHSNLALPVYDIDHYHDYESLISP